MNVRFAMVAAMAIVMTLLPATAAAAQPPGNDDFSAATPLSGVPFEDIVDVGEATVEPGEPTETCAPFANTVWYDLTVDAAIDVVVDTAGSNYDTTVAVWTGPSLENLDNVTCVDDTFTSLQAAASFSADPGETYHIQVGAFGEASEGATLQLSIDEAARPTGRPDIFKTTSRGIAANAFVEDFDPETGGFSFTQVSVSQTREKFFKQQPFRSSTLFVIHFEENFDPETGQYSFTELFGTSELTSDQFNVDRQLTSGFVMADITLEGISCTEGPNQPNGEGFEFETVCTELGPESAGVDVVWEGRGPLAKSRFTDRFSSDGIRFSFRGTSTSRDAAVSGSVQGDALAFDLDGASGSLSRDSFAEMIVSRGGILFF